LGYGRLPICLPASRRDRCSDPYSGGDGSGRSRFCSGGVTRKREEEDVGAKDPTPKRARTVEEPTYLPPVPVTTLAPRHMLNLLGPPSGERSRYLAVLMLTVHQGSGRCDNDGYSVARRYHSRGCKQTLQGCGCPNKEQTTALKSFSVWCHPRGAADKSGDGNRCNGRSLLQSK